MAQREVLGIDYIYIMSQGCLLWSWKSEKQNSHICFLIKRHWLYLACLRLCDCSFIYEMTSNNMMYSVFLEKVKGNWYLFCPCIFLGMCCVSAFLIKATEIPILFTVIADREHFYAIWQFLNWLTESYSWDLLGVRIRMYLCQSASGSEAFHFFFSWSVS